jgi:hypothetical protein
VDALPTPAKATAPMNLAKMLHVQLQIRTWIPLFFTR